MRIVKKNKQWTIASTCVQLRVVLRGRCHNSHIYVASRINNESCLASRDQGWIWIHSLALLSAPIEGEYMSLKDRPPYSRKKSADESQSIQRPHTAVPEPKCARKNCGGPLHTVLMGKTLSGEYCFSTCERRKCSRGSESGMAKFALINSCRISTFEIVLWKSIMRYWRKTSNKAIRAQKFGSPPSLSLLFSRRTHWIT